MDNKIKRIMALIIVISIIVGIKFLMDNPLLIIVAAILLALFISLRIYLSTPQGKGKLGELVVRVVIGKNKPKKDKYSIHNLTFSIEERSVQIDHVYITKAGIHVIETKNYAGRIYGSERDANWTQVLAFGRVKNKLYNPLRQNYGHIKALEEKIGYEEFYKNIIVFTGRADVRDELKNIVYYPLQLKSIKKNKDKKLSSIQVKDIYDKLLILKEENTVSNKEHIKNVQDIIANKEKQSDL